MKASTKSKRIISCALALALVFALSVNALAASNTKTSSTPWGTLTGTLSVTSDSEHGGWVYVDCLAQINSSTNMSVMHADYEVYNYLTGTKYFETRIKNVSSSKEAIASNVYPRNDCPARMTIYGCAEVRHTTSYAVWPTLYDVAR